MAVNANGWNGDWHPLAVRFPMLGEDDLRDMAASIAERGQFVPCRRDPNGLGLDGRNRVAACALAGVEPVWEVYEGDAVAFIVDVNSERRHLTTGQRAMAVAIGLEENGARLKSGRWKPGTVPDVNRGSSVERGSSWQKATGMAGVVLDHAPELSDDVLAGSMALDAAHKVAVERRDARARVDALGGELAALVDNGVISVDEAERRADEAERIGKLDTSLAERVEAGTLALTEAELIANENDKRVVAWAERVSDALDVLAPMVGNPVPDKLAAALGPKRHGVLVLILNKLGDTA